MDQQKIAILRFRYSINAWILHSAFGKLLQHLFVLEYNRLVADLASDEIEADVTNY